MDPLTINRRGAKTAKSQTQNSCQPFRLFFLGAHGVLAVAHFSTLLIVPRQEGDPQMHLFLFE